MPVSEKSFLHFSLYPFPLSLLLLLSYNLNEKLKRSRAHGAYA